MFIVIDWCDGNTECGQKGECANVAQNKSFECHCKRFYEGPRCEYCKIIYISQSGLIWINDEFVFLNFINSGSTQFKQMIVSSGLVFLAFALVFANLLQEFLHPSNN